MGGETRQSPTPAASGIQPRRIPRIEHWRTPLLDAIFSGLLSGAFAPGHHGYPRASETYYRKDLKGQNGTQSLGCAGQTVCPSLHSISQTLVGKLSIFSFYIPVLS